MVLRDRIMNRDKDDDSDPSKIEFKTETRVENRSTLLVSREKALL